MIIGISGKAQSGKDTVGKIIQYLIACSKHPQNKPTIEIYLKRSFQYNNAINISGFKTQKFADKVKDIVCLLINCDKEQLEDETFKNTELGEEWTKFYLSHYKLITEENSEGRVSPYFDSYEQTLIYKREMNYLGAIASSNIQEQKMTPRLLMQLVGTDCGRYIIHPNLWLNSLFINYKKTFTGLDVANHFVKSDGTSMELKYPNWIITDLRFPNELKAIKDRRGITIRVNRETKFSYDGLKDMISDTIIEQHPSETALDDATFDYSINNNDTIEKLVEQVKGILIKEKLL